MAKPNKARAKEAVVPSEREKRMEAAMAKAIRELKRDAKLQNVKLVVADKSAWITK